MLANWTTGKSSRFLKRALWSAIICCKTSCWNCSRTRGDILLPYRSQRSLKLVQCTTKTLGAFFLPCTKQTSCWHVALPRWMCPAMLPRFSSETSAAFICSKVKHTRFCFGCSLSQLQHTAKVAQVYKCQAKCLLQSCWGPKTAPQIQET